MKDVDVSDEVIGQRHLNGALVKVVDDKLTISGLEHTPSGMVNTRTTHLVHAYPRTGHCPSSQATNRFHSLAHSNERKPCGDGDGG